MRSLIPMDLSKRNISDRGVEIRSEVLAGRRIAFGISGGIAAVECVKQIRELRRHGAVVIPYLTAQAQQFLTPLAISWAAHEDAVLEWDARVEHLDLYDLVLLCPLTLNTLSKIAAGMGDNPVTLLAASQIGRGGRLLCVPSMNEVLARHPIYREHRARLESWGARFLEPEIEEGRWKAIPAERLAHAVRELLG